MINLAPIKHMLQGKPIAIVGLGRSGLSVFEACKAAGIDTVLWDDNADMRQAAIDKSATVEDLSDADFKQFALLCLAPGIPLTHPKPHWSVARAKKAGIEIIGDVELFHRAKPDAKTIAITGTNGKSTTTALTGHILKTAGIESAIGGNIGEAVLGLPDLSTGSIYVLELSSYQLDLLGGFSPDISALLNIAPDHLDRHGGMEGYIAAKERIFRNGGIGVIGVDDAASSDMFARLKKAGVRKMTAVSVLRPLANGIFVSVEGELFEGSHPIIDLNTCNALRGQHNWQNAAIAYTLCRAAGVSAPAIVEGLRTFPGLAHRQKIAATINGIAYINDSKATNDDAASKALGTYSPIYWIAGGKPKDGGYAACEKYLDRVHHAFLIGEAAESMSAWLGKFKVRHTLCETLDNAVAAAHKMAQKEQKDHAVVLLSPACASFDQFKSFEQRGDAFVTLVEKLADGNKKPQKGKAG